MTEYSECSSPIEMRLSSGFMEKSRSAPSTPTETTKMPHSRTIYFQAGKRVCFPNDELMVTGYYDAPDPWTQASEPTTGDLLTAYEAACNKQCIKPLLQVQVQLQEISSFDKRYKELSLRGLRLDHRHCESLEEIFKRVQFVKLSFEACNLDDEGAAALFDMIEYYESAKQLDVSFNKRIDTRGWQALSRMLKKTPCIETLDLCGTPLDDQALLILGRALRLGSHLVSLRVENCGIYGRCLVVLVAAIKLNSTLKEVYLADNKMSPSDGIQIGNLLRSNTWLEILDLRSNNLQDSGAVQIIEGLCEQTDGPGKSLRSLILSHNCITHSAMASLGRCLPQKRLATLNIGNNFITDDGIHELKQGLLSSPTLSHLGLENAQITCEGAVALAEYIADSKTVSCINLLDNRIGVAGLLALVRSMHHNSTVIQLQIDAAFAKESESEEESEERGKLLTELEEYCLRNRSAREAAALPEENSPESDPIPVGLNATKNVSSFESYFQAGRSFEHASLELRDMNSARSPSRFKVSRVFLEKEVDASTRRLGTSAPPDLTSDFIQTSLDALKSSLQQMNGVAAQDDRASSNKEGETSCKAASEGKKNGRKRLVLFADLPSDVGGSSQVKDRRMSTPAMPVTSRILCRPSPMKLCKHLESLDLRSSIPISPTRLLQGWVFPEPSLDNKQ